LDLDVLVPQNLPDIFSEMPADAGFAAVVDPRGSPAYRKAWGFADWTTRDHRERFEELGLTSRSELFTINGGVLGFRPRLVVHLFEARYLDDSRYVRNSEAEYNSDEIPMAFLSQTHGLFAPLEYRFNRQVNYALHETDLGKIAFEEYRSLFNRIRRRARKALGRPIHHVGYGRTYRPFIEDLLRNGNLVHFAGRYPIPVVDKALLAQIRSGSPDGSGPIG
jgi:hypothetical protein